MNKWERFDDVVSAEEVVEAKSAFENPQPGVYKVKLEQLKPDESQNGIPMLKGRFRKQDNGIIFYNQVLQNINYPNMTKVNVAQAVDVVSKLRNENVDFTTLGSFAELILSMNELNEAGEIVKLKPEYMVDCEIRISYGKKDSEMKFPKITVLGLVEPSEDDQVEDLNDSGLPF